MYPYLFGIEDIPMYGFLMAVGFAVGIAAAVFLGRNEGIRRSDVFFCTLFVFVFAIVGAKLFAIVGNLDYVLQGTLSFIDLLVSGFVFYGGLIGGAVGVLVYCGAFGIPLVDMLDRLAFAVPLGHAIGRMGCLCSGCCYGKETDSAIGIVFEHPLDPFTPTGVKLVPTQIIEALTLVVIFVVLLVMNRKRTPRGSVVFAYCVLYATARFVIEFFRGDIWRVFNETMTGSQLISLFILVVAITAVVVHFVRKRRIFGKLYKGAVNESYSRVVITERSD